MVVDGVVVHGVDVDVVVGSGVVVGRVVVYGVVVDVVVG